MAEQHENMQQQHHQQGQHITAQILNVQGGVATLGDSTPIQIMMPTGVVNVMDEHQQVPHHVQEMQEVVQEAVGGTQDPPEDPKLTNKKELSKQWKSLCKRAKQWCSMHDDSVPNFVMMYLDENRLVWEGPDHMESFISDEGVISAFLRTAALSESLIGMEKRGADDIQETAQRPAKKQKSAETASTSKKGMTDEEVIASILEKPEAESQDSTQDIGAGGDENDSDSGAGQAAEGHQPSQSTSEGPSQGGEGDVLSQVIESVIKEWAPGQGPPPRTSPGEEEGDGSCPRNVVITLCQSSKPNSATEKILTQARLTPNIAYDPLASFTIQPGKNQSVAEHAKVKMLSSLRAKVKKSKGSKRGINYLEPCSIDVPKLDYTPCPICQRQVPSPYLEEHVLLHEEKKLGEQSRYIACKVCCEPIEYSSLEDHIRNHISKGEADYQVCDVCLTVVQTKTYRKHLLIHERKLDKKPAPFHCSTCQKPFWRKSQLKYHQSTHSAQSVFTCEICGKSYRQKAELNRHRRKFHLGALPYVCSLCGKGFLTKYELSRHDMGHKNIRPYKCERCDKCFVTKIELNIHVRSVHEKKPRYNIEKIKLRRYACDVCSKSFTQNIILVEHKKTHTGELPYVCEVCGQSFRHKSTVKKHMYMHTGEMPYECKHCGQKFRANSNMNLHIRKHHDGGKCFCHICGKGFGNDIGLQTHLKKHNVNLHISDIRAMDLDKPKHITGASKTQLPTPPPVPSACSVRILASTLRQPVPIQPKPQVPAPTKLDVPLALPTIQMHQLQPQSHHQNQMLQQLSVQQVHGQSQQQQQHTTTSFSHVPHQDNPFPNSQHLYQPAQQQPFMDSLGDHDVFLPLMDSRSGVSSNESSTNFQSRDTNLQ